eukprot:9986369-Alexandrium_andersonii.AAC.1
MAMWLHAVNLHGLRQVDADWAAAVRRWLVVVAAMARVGGNDEEWMALTTAVEVAACRANEA